MISRQALDQFLNKKIFVKIIDEERVQVGVLNKVGEDYLLESNFHRTLINPAQVARVTEEYGGGK